MGRTNYLWDEVNDTLLRETDERGNVIVQYAHEPTRFGPLISQRRNGHTYHHHYDGLGSTRALTDESGAVTDRYTYTAFGEPVASSGTTTNPFGYKGALGYYANPETNDLYVRARSYQPWVARWSAQDSFDSTDSSNKYQYAGNAPTRAADPSGLTVFVLGWEGFGARPPFGLPAFSDAVLENRYKPLAEGALPGHVAVFFGGENVLNPIQVGQDVSGIIEKAKEPEYYVGCYPCYRRFILVGYSWGGNTARKVAIQMAQLDPTVKIDAVFTIDPVIGNVPKSDVFPSSPNVCRWNNYYQKTSIDPLFHGDVIDGAQNREVTKKGFADGP